ncbi:MAG: pilus assembly protein PilM [Pseudomonadota bacterium]
MRSIDGESAERQVLVAVAQQQQVLAYLELLRSSGLDPVALDIGPAAIARLLAAMARDDFNQSVLLINFGLQKSFLTVIWGRRLMLDREIDFGEASLAAKLASSLGMPAEIARGLMREHGIGARTAARPAAVAQPDIGRTIREILHPEFAVLAEELLRTQVYVASRTRGSTLSRVYLNGSLARYPNIQQRLSELVALPVAVLDPFDGFAPVDGGAPRAEVGKNIALAAGLALRGEPNG